MEYDIRGGQGVSPFVAIGEKYGDQLVKGIVQAGADIEQGLQRVQTNRELQGMSQILSQLDPKTPDYTQKLLMLKGQFPLASMDPRGLASVAMGFKEHTQWQAGQQALQRSTMSLQNSKELIDYRASKRPAGQDGVDLTGMFEGAPLPDQLSPQNPATNSGFSFGAGQDGVNAGNGADVPLAGMNGTLPENSGGMEGVLPPSDFQPVGKPATPGAAPVDPLMQRALKPLRDTQIATGVKPTKAQVFGAVSAEKTREQQRISQEDRQAQQDKRDADKEAARAIKEAATEKKSELTAQRETINKQLSSIESDIKRLPKEIRDARKRMEDFAKSMSNTEEDKATRTDLEGELNAVQIELRDAGKERSRLIGELENMGKDEVFATEEEALAAGKLAGDIVTIINPKTGKPAKARLE